MKSALEMWPRSLATICNIKSIIQNSKLIATLGHCTEYGSFDLQFAAFDASWNLQNFTKTLGLNGSKQYNVYFTSSTALKKSKLCALKSIGAK